MKGIPINQLVYDCIFPNPKPGDPQNFYKFLQCQLVPEVRSETVLYYGNLRSLKAQYLGLDYSYTLHRMRLGQFHWHRELFRTFESLGLTQSEITGLAK